MESLHAAVVPGLDRLPCYTNGGILCECVQHSSDVVEQSPALSLAREGSCHDEREGGGGNRGDGERDACVLYEEDGGIATVTLNRPKVRVKERMRVHDKKSPAIPIKPGSDAVRLNTEHKRYVATKPPEHGNHSLPQ